MGRERERKEKSRELIFAEAKRREHFNEEMQPVIPLLLVDPATGQRVTTGFNNMEVARGTLTDKSGFNGAVVMGRQWGWVWRKWE